jgi:hypothetical protein
LKKCRGNCQNCRRQLLRSQTRKPGSSTYAGLYVLRQFLTPLPSIDFWKLALIPGLEFPWQGNYPWIGTKPVAGSQFLGGHCRKNVTEAEPKNYNYHFRGQKKFSGTINCLYCSIFKRILHDYLYLKNKLQAFWLFGFFISYFTNTYGFSFQRTDSIFANCIFSEHTCRNHA